MAALQRISGLLPDLSGLIPEPLKPYAKFVVVVALGLIYLLVSLTVIDDATGREWAGIVAFVATALGVAGTTNESEEDDDLPPDDAVLSDEGDVVDPSGELGFPLGDEEQELVAEQLPAEPPPEPAPPPEGRDRRGG